MESESFLQETVIFLVSVIVSAFFSGSETAFLSLSSHELARADDIPAKISTRVRNLVRRKQELLIAILLGNTIANIAAASMAAIVATGLAVAHLLNKDLIIMIEVVVVTLVLLILSEITPKVIAVRNPLEYARSVSGVLTVYMKMVRPITFVLEHFTKRISKNFSVKTGALPLKEEDLQALFEVGEEHRALEADEREMLHSIFTFHKKQVKEVMVPRIDMVCIEKNATISELINLIKQKGHTRIPVYEERIDNIRGMIHAKDLLPYMDRADENIDLEQLARPALFTPETKQIDDLLREFQEQKTHMAIVVDEYGGTAGLVTLEDILEEIVGEIQDEYDRETPLFRKIEDNIYLVNAKIDLHDLNRKLNLDLPTEPDYESLGGFIFSLTGTVPREKQIVPYENFRFTIEQVERNRILQVRIEKLNDQEETPASLERE